MLRQKRLAHLAAVSTECVLQFVDASRTDAQLDHRRQADRGRQRLQQLNRTRKRVKGLALDHNTTLVDRYIRVMPWTLPVMHAALVLVADID